MNTTVRRILWLLLALTSLPLLAQTPTTFTYQGRLYDSAVPADGNYVLRITPFGQASGGAALAPAIDTPPLNVVEGIFSTTLDFGASVFLGAPVWLEIQVQAPGGSFQLLTPRQPVNATPYAINADKLDGLDAGQLTPQSGGVIAFSSGPLLAGATVVSSQPVLLGFGSRVFQVIDGSGESTMPPEPGGFAFPVPFAGTISNLQISADLLVASASAINTIGLQYDFQVFRAPSSPNNGIDHLSAPYTTTPLTGSLRFGAPNTVVIPGTFRTATNHIGGSLVVAAGDRIGIRVRTLGATDPSAADITQLSFSATLTYTPSP